MSIELPLIENHTYDHLACLSKDCEDCERIMQSS